MHRQSSLGVNEIFQNASLVKNANRLFPYSIYRPISLRGCSFLLLILPLLYHCCDQAWRTRVRKFFDSNLWSKVPIRHLSWRQHREACNCSFKAPNSRLTRQRSNIVRAKWLNHNVISNNSFWLVIYAWKKTAWNVPRKEFFGSNLPFGYFQKPWYLFLKRHLVIKKYRLSNHGHIKAKKNGKEKYQSSWTPEHHNKFAYGFPRQNWEKLLIKICSLALGWFYRSLIFYYLSHWKWIGDEIPFKSSYFALLQENRENLPCFGTKILKT